MRKALGLSWIPGVVVLAANTLLSACASSAYAPSTDPRDLDLSAYNQPAITGRDFTVSPDVRVFALFAFLNTVGGYDNESGDSMAPLRVSLRADVNLALGSVDPERVARWKRFYASHRFHPWAYLACALTLGSPPRRCSPGSSLAYRGRFLAGADRADA